MAYNQNIPAANDLLSQSQAQILANFQEINTFLIVNHEAFNGAAQGKHKFLTLTQGTVSGTFPLATTVTEMGIYCKTNGANPALYVRKPDQAVGVVTDAKDIDITTAGLADPGWLKLPSGIIMKWGYATATSTAGVPVVTITYPVGAGIPAFATAVYSVQLTPYGTNAANMDRAIRLQGYGNILNFRVVSTKRYDGAFATCEFTYLAIGY